MRLSAIEMDVCDLLEDEDLHPKVILSKNQRKRKLNELMTEEVEDRTLEAFSDYSKREHGVKPNIAKRPPQRDFKTYNGERKYHGHGHNKPYSHHHSSNKPSRGRGGSRNHF